MSFNFKKLLFFCVPGQNLPFHVRFLSDNYEFTDEALLAQKGFKLQYEQFNCA
jgi:hypothetical protein